MLAGRLGWSFEQIRQTPLEVSQLCERLGWRGSEGYQRLLMTPRQKILDWVVIASLEKELKRG